jgi:hypothetical protein
MTCWTAIVGFSGTGKTPGIDVTKRALAMIQKSNEGRIAVLERKHNAKREEAKAANKKWLKEVADAVEAGMPAPPMPENAADIPPFTAPRLYVSDATVERLAVMLQARPQGALYIADELAGLFLNMGRYSNGSDREFWLEAWNGKHFVVERMGRPAVSIDHLLIGVTGGLQPDKLEKSFGGDSDGLYARMLFAWPDEPSYRPLTNDVAEVEPDTVNALNRLAELSPLGEPITQRMITLSSDAVRAFEDFRRSVSAAKGGLDGREREWWAKAETHVLRLSGTLVLLEWSLRGGDEPTDITAQAIEAAAGMIRDYFWHHARASLRQFGLSERHATARRVLRWIRANRSSEPIISVSDVRRDALGQSVDEAGALELIEKLEAAGWLRRLDQEASKGPGRQKHRWQVNPALFR